MPLDAERLQKGRNRLTQVFHFLEDLNQKRNPAKRKVSEYSWTLWLRDLPDHPTIIQGTIKEIPAIGVNEDIEFAGDDFILKVLRPTLTQPPQPPQDLELWLKKGWE